MIDISTIPVPPGFRLVPIAATDEPVIHALDRAWTRIRADNTGIPELVFNLQPGRTSGCTAIEWDSSPIMTLNLAPSWDGEPETLAEHKLTGAQILEILLHHAGHAAAGPSKSQEGRWHTELYRDTAQRLGLAVAHGSAGYNRTSIASATGSRYRHEIAALDRAMVQWNPGRGRKSQRGPVSMRCSCSPPRVLRVSTGVAAAGQIRCGICGQSFTAG